MAFREVDEGESRLARVPREATAWLREIFLEDWTLKLIALVISFGLWFAITGQRKPTTIRLRNVQLDFQLPNDMEISNDPRRDIDITVSGSSDALENLNRRELVARVDVSNYRPGDRVVQLTDRIIDLPQGIKVVKIEPNTVPLRLEPSVEREVEVEARREGNLPEGFELYGVTVAPARVRVRGPQSHVNALQKAMTETIPIEGRRESFSIQQVAIDVPDQKITVIDPVVNVRLEIGELRVEKSFAGVNVLANNGAQARPPQATVTLYGPKSVLEQLRPEDVQLILEVDDDGGVRNTQLQLPQGLANRVQLRSTRPTGFSIIKSNQ
ncbi:MAG TPA: CdaR family protein [Pyrinomonadaceae bacterium]|nr:CdaR family protein [Pyrinomonadaceae bacterium]